MASHVTPRDIRWYVKLAKTTAKLRSNRALSERLRGSHGMVAHWEKMAQYERAGGYPTESTMKELARLAGVPEQLALFDRLAWITEDDGMRETFVVHADAIWNSMLAENHPATHQPTYSFSTTQFKKLATILLPLAFVLSPENTAKAASDGKQIGREQCILWK